MGAAVLRGVSAGLLVTVLTLLGGMLWNSMGLGAVNATTVVDIGLFLSCVVGGYRTGKESGVWVLGGVAGALFVGVGAVLLALFLPLRAAGVLQVMLEGGVLGLVAGAVGARAAGVGLSGRSAWRGFYRPGSYASRYRSYSVDESEAWKSDLSGEAWESDLSAETFKDERVPSMAGRPENEDCIYSRGKRQHDSGESEWDRLFGQGGHENSRVYDDRSEGADLQGQAEWERRSATEKEPLKERKAVSYGLRVPWWEEEVGKR